MVSGFRPFSALCWSALLCVAVGCRADAEKEESPAGGLEPLPGQEVFQLSQVAGLASSLTAAFGFRVGEDFHGDLSADETYELASWDSQWGYQGADSAQRLCLTLRKKKFSTGVMTVERFQVVGLADLSVPQQVTLLGERFYGFLDGDQKVDRRDHQAGEYLVACPKQPAGSFTFLHGTVKRLGTDGSQEEVTGAVIYHDTLPVAAVSGRGGRYILPIVTGSSGVLGAHKPSSKNDGKDAPAEMAFLSVAPSGPLGEEASDIVEAKQKQFRGTKSRLDFDWHEAQREHVSSFLKDTYLQQQDILFPLSQTVFNPPPEQALADTPPPPTESLRADPSPPEGSVVMRKPLADVDDNRINVDLGCSGIRQDGETVTLTTDEGAFASFQGWRGFGDVRHTIAQHVAIFGDPQSGALRANQEYLDETLGYCLLTTGDGQFQKSDKEYQPQQLRPQGGKFSSMWQPLKIPASAASLQIRFAVFSQEASFLQANAFSDRIFFAFDEDVGFLASGDLASFGSPRAEECAGKDRPCPVWPALEVGATPQSFTTGSLWDVDLSQDATKAQEEFCDKQACYHRWSGPRVACVPITQAMGRKTLTLRMGVMDVGDEAYDTALAVDSMVFSTKTCEFSKFVADSRWPPTP